VGDKFSVADILPANTLNWARARNFEIESAALNSYADRMMARPALARAHERERAAK
jgi:glutathione S-transferase